MNKYVPYEKMSKKQKREVDRAKRTTWGAFSPVTRRAPPIRAYHRAKLQAQLKKEKY